MKTRILIGLSVMTLASTAFPANDTAKPKPDTIAPRTREFVVEKKYLAYPIHHRGQTQRIVLSVDGREVHKYYGAKISLTEQKWIKWMYIDISPYLGKKMTLYVNRNTEEGFKLIRQVDEIPDQDRWYKETMRPQFHFSQPVGWNNDVNGTVYHDGEWHLSYQHNPVGLKWGNISWGHAVSKDLVHWELLPMAVTAHTMATGMCWSGSANVDVLNTAGFKKGREDTLFIFFTDQQGGECLAYSTDRGRTYTAYEHNPVLKHNGRDPKVIWYPYGKGDQPLNDEAGKLGGHWVMAVYQFGKGGNGNTAFASANEKDKHLAFYTSTNLKTWRQQSRLENFYECVELFQLPVDDNPKKKKWVVYAGDAKYGIGQFDGRELTQEHEGRYTLFAGPFYGSQIFSRAPNGRAVVMGWLNIDIHGQRWNQLISIPYELTLRTTRDGIRLFANPVKEIEVLRKKSYQAPPAPLSDGKPLAIRTNDELFDMTAEFEIGSAEKVGFKIGDLEVVYHVEAKQLGDRVEDLENAKGMKSCAVLEPVEGKITIRVLVDRPLMEIIGNDGRVVVTKDKPNLKSHHVSEIAAFARGGEARLLRFEVHELNSVWGK